MPLSWNEIRHRAIAFSKEWTGVKRESAEKQTFWNEFFDVFGIRRRVVASFEEPVQKISGKYGFIDLFWPGAPFPTALRARKPCPSTQPEARCAPSAEFEERRVPRCAV